MTVISLASPFLFRDLSFSLSGVPTQICLQQTSQLDGRAWKQAQPAHETRRHTGRGPTDFRHREHSQRKQ